MNASRDGVFAQPGDVWPVQLAPDGGDPAEFAAAVVDEVRARLARHLGRTATSQGRSPAALVERLAGLDPLYVVPALVRIARSGSRTDADLAAMASAALDQLHTPTSRARRDLHGLPTEHPLDYDWRFDRPTRGAIIDAVRRVKPDRVLLLGCPTLAVDRRMPPVPTTLIDDNPALAVSDPSNLVRHHRVDILNQPLFTAGVEADCVIADPPFYSEIVAAFLCAAAAGLHIGGTCFWCYRVGGPDRRPPQTPTKPSPSPATSASPCSTVGQMRHATSHRSSNGLRTTDSASLASRTDGAPPTWHT